MKKQVLTLLLAVLLAGSAVAEDFRVGILRFDITGPNTVEVAPGNYAGVDEIIIPSTVTHNGVTYTVTAIAADAFREYSYLSHITIPATVTSIGDDAFYYLLLESLTTYADITNWRAFGQCTIVHRLYVGDGVRQLKGLYVQPMLIYSFAETPPECDANTFRYCTAAVHVTQRGFTNYLTAPYWSSFDNIVADAGAMPTSLELNADEATLELGGTVQLTATLSQASTVPVRWASSNTTVATVDANGLVSAVKEGQTVITATCMGLQQCCVVTVVGQVVTVSLSEHSLTLSRNDMVTLTATTAPIEAEVNWITTDNNVAIVRAAGNKATVIGNRPGEALVIARTAGANDCPDTCRVTVERPRGDATADGFTDVDDLNAIINVMLNKAGAIEDADRPYYDITGDGNIDVDDMNKLINIMLGVPELLEGGKRYTVNGVSFVMVAVEGGTFTMGATAEQGSDAYDSEMPAHQVTLSSYSIGETEVTQALWVAVMGTNPSYFNGYGNAYYGSEHSENYGTNLQRPVEWVSWDKCQTFITKLNQLTDETFRLPTEAEWEYAARGGNKSRGYKYAGSNTIGDVAWYDVNAYDVGSSSPNYGTHTVATKSPNELGLYDMSGNVWEWCQDWYGGYSSGAQTNPTGPTSGSYRVFRGGSWNNSARDCRVSSRGNWPADFRYNALGLRLAR